MCRGRDVYDWVRQLDVSPSTRRWTVEVYVPQVPPQVQYLLWTVRYPVWTVRSTWSPPLSWTTEIFETLSTMVTITQYNGPNKINCKVCEVVWSI